MVAEDSISIARFLPPRTSLDLFETEMITPLFKPVELKKGEFFIHIGDKVTDVAIVDKGILCRYSDHEKDHKVIDQFLCDNQFFSDREGYFSNDTSFTHIQALTPCHLWTIPIDQVEMLAKTSHHMALIMNSIFKQTWNHEMILKNMLLIKDPLKRILRFYELYGHWVSDIPVGDIQIYLNISHAYYYELLHKFLKNVCFRTFF